MFQSVKSQKIFTPQAYLELMTNECYFLKHEMHPSDEIQEILSQNDIEVWDYPLDEIDHCVENEIPVVLVDVSHYEKNDYVSEYRWFEIDEEKLREYTED